MKSAFATAILTVLLLNAGAFASDNRAYLRAKPKDINVTVLTKNQPWPVRTQTVEPCPITSCAGV